MINGVQPALKARHQVVGNAGLFYAAYRLSQLGWNVMPTSRNARGIDLVAYDPGMKRFVGIQVKTLSARNPVPLGQDINNVAGDYWVIVTRMSAEHPCSFVMLPREVKRLAHRGERDGRISFWLQPPSYDRDRFRERWDRIA
jgi:hypothetical protein